MNNKFNIKDWFSVVIAMANKINNFNFKKLATHAKVLAKRLIGCLERSKYAIHVKAKDLLLLNLASIAKDKDLYINRIMCKFILMIY